QVRGEIRGARAHAEDLREDFAMGFEELRVDPWGGHLPQIFSAAAVAPQPLRCAQQVGPLPCDLERLHRMRPGPPVGGVSLRGGFEKFPVPVGLLANAQQVPRLVIGADACPAGNRRPPQVAPADLGIDDVERSPTFAPSPNRLRPRAGGREGIGELARRRAAQGKLDLGEGLSRRPECEQFSAAPRAAYPGADVGSSGPVGRGTHDTPALRSRYASMVRVWTRDREPLALSTYPMDST